jgi:hypothetical protein
MSAAHAIQVIALSRNLSLVPVVEFAPGQYARQGRVYPQQTGDEAPDAWRRYWLDCLSDSGIQGLVPLRPGSWLVPVRQLTDPHILRQLVRVEFKQISFSGSAEEADDVGTLSGGYALLDAGQLVIEPRCCGDLRNLKEWRDAALRQCDGSFWIGHPMLHAAVKGEHVALREDEMEHSGDMPLREWLLSPDALAQAIPDAAREQEAFSRRLEPILAERLDSSLVVPLARRLAGLDEL